MTKKESGMKQFFSKLKPANEDCCNITIEEVKSEDCCGETKEKAANDK